MVNFLFPLSPDQLKLRGDLQFIRNHISNARQAKLLQRRARTLFQRNRLIPTRGPRVQRILALVDEIRTQVSNVSPLDSAKNPNVENHKRYCEILRQGFAALNTQTNRSSGRIQEDAINEERAIRRDQDEIEMTIKSRRPPPPRQIRIFKMDSPRDQPIILSESFSTYRDILFYLREMLIVSMPDLWIRHPERHTLTKSGYKWEYVHGSENVGSFDLDVVDVAKRHGYIVALLHEKANDEEIPVPLELSKFGDTSCCNPPCGNLATHLKSIWPDRRVIIAKRFSEITNEAVFATALDNSFFKEKTNDLYLLWRPAPCPSAQPPSQSS